MGTCNLATDDERVACDDAIKAGVLDYLYAHPGRTLIVTLFRDMLEKLRPHHAVLEIVRTDMLLSRMTALFKSGAIYIEGDYEWVRLTASQWLSITRREQESSGACTKQTAPASTGASCSGI